MPIKKQGPGQYRVDVTRAIGGRQVRRRATCTTRDDARRREAMLRDELERLARGEAAATRATLGDFAQRWLSRKAQTIKPSTAAKYVQSLERILPLLGHRYIDSLRPSDVASAVAEIGGAAYTQRNHLVLLRQIAKDTIAEGLADLDWTARVKPPTPAGYTEQEPNLLTADELPRLLAAIPDQWSVLAYVLAFTGIRWGEASALRWEDLELDRQQAWIRNTNWKGMLLPPKNRRSVRTVPLAEPLPVMLREHRQRLLAAQHPGLPAGFVFATRRGTLHCGTPLGKVLDKACPAAGVPRITVHGLRRTFNNLVRQVTAGMVVRAIIGHSDESMTAHYSVVSADEKLAAATAVVRMLPGGPGADSDTCSDTCGPQAGPEVPPMQSKCL